MKKRKAGISKSETDKVQPYRVWDDSGHIVWFARTKEEAELKLREFKVLKGGK